MFWELSNAETTLRKQLLPNESERQANCWVRLAAAASRLLGSCRHVPGSAGAGSMLQDFGVSFSVRRSCLPAALLRAQIIDAGMCTLFLHS